MATSKYYSDPPPLRHTVLVSRPPRVKRHRNHNTPKEGPGALHTPSLPARCPSTDSARCRTENPPRRSSLSGPPPPAVIASGNRILQAF